VIPLITKEKLAMAVPAATRRRINNLRKKANEIKMVLGNLKQGLDTVEVTVDLNTPHATCQGFRRYLGNVRELAIEGVLEPSDLSLYEDLICYNFKPIPNTMNILLTRKFPVNPENDASHDAVLNMRPGVSATARSNLQEHMEELYTMCGEVKPVVSMVEDDDLAAIMAEMNTPTQSELEEEFNSKSGYDDLF
jgi:hypothetical protein